MTAPNDNSPIDLDAIMVRANAASEGPWHTEDADDGPGAVFGPSREFVAETYTGEGSGGIVAEAITGGPQQQNANAAFIAAAREDVPALVARVRDLTAKLDAACRLAADVPRLQREVADARREGAEAMRSVALRVARAEAARCDYGADSPYAGRPDERDAALRVAEELRVCAGPRWEP